MELSAIAAKIKLEHPIMNAAGPNCKLVPEAESLSEALVSAVMIGSGTKNPREGNQGETYYSNGSISLNSLGLPNPGISYYVQRLPEMAEFAHQRGKPLFFSIAGFSPEEYAELAARVADTGIDLLELNLGCPNVWDQGKQKRIICFDPQTVSQTIKLVTQSLPASSPRLAVKLSPFSDPVALEEISSVISSFPRIDAITATNTFPNGFAFDEYGNPAIRSLQVSKGLAGLAGPAMKSIGLGHVIQLKNLVRPDIDIIGAGGISNGRDVWDYLQAGASAVQIATAFADRGHRVFSEILTQFIHILEAEEMLRT